MSDKPEYSPKRAPRVDAHLKAVVTAGPKRSSSFMIDSMSVTGARLTGPLALVLGQRVSVTFTAEGRSLAIEVEVVRVDTADLLNDQVAVKFIDVSDEAKVAMDEFVRHRLEEDADEEATKQGKVVEPDSEETVEGETVIEVD